MQTVAVERLEQLKSDLQVDMDERLSSLRDVVSQKEATIISVS